MGIRLGKIMLRPFTPFAPASTADRCNRRYAGLPTVHRRLDRQKISMLTVFRVLFDGGPSPRESTTGCRTDGLFRQTSINA